ncbi:MAG TPA: ABC transporter permease [Candidatus Dormibacteraeota bacterium]|jgi:ABC-2 type transport system permease protein
MTPLRDTALVFRRYMLQTLRNPVWMFFGIVQPIMYLVLFAPLLVKVASSAPGFPQGGAYNVFIPGLLVQLGLFGASGVGFGLISELRMGVIERFRVTPISRISLLLGRALRDVVIISAQSLLLIICAIPFGLTISGGGILVVLLLIALIGLMTASLSYTIALAVKSEDAFAPIVFGATLPLLLLSGVLLPLQLAPDWLRVVAAFNPLKYAVDASRAAFNTHLTDVAVAQGFAVMLCLGIIAVLLAARAFGRAVA